MSKILDIKVLQKALDTANAIFDEKYHTNLTKKIEKNYATAMKAWNTTSSMNSIPNSVSGVDLVKEQLFEHQDKYRRILELQAPFEEAKLYIQAYKPRLFKRNPFKKHKELVENYENLLRTEISLIKQAERALVRAQDEEEEEKRFTEKMAQSQTQLQAFHSFIQSKKEEENRAQKAQANLLAFLTNQSQKEYEEAVGNSTGQNLNYEEAIARFQGKRKGGAKKTRRLRKKTQATRKQ
jgi:hypothetical protein